MELPHEGHPFGLNVQPIIGQCPHCCLLTTYFCQMEYKWGLISNTEKKCPPWQYIGYGELYCIMTTNFNVY